MGLSHYDISDHGGGNEQGTGQDQEKEVGMKFLFIALGIRRAIKIISNKRNKANSNKKEVMNKSVRHPAEFQLR